MYRFIVNPRADLENGYIAFGFTTRLQLAMHEDTSGDAEHPHVYLRSFTNLVIDVTMDKNSQQFNWAKLASVLQNMDSPPALDILYGHGWTRDAILTLSGTTTTTMRELKVSLHRDTKVRPADLARRPEAALKEFFERVDTRTIDLMNCVG